MRCPHGINLKHKTCSACEEVAEAEGKKGKKLQYSNSGKKGEPRTEVSPAPAKPFYDVDLNRLHEHLEGFPRLYHEHATLLAEAKKATEEAKASRDLTEAELDADVRKHPEDYTLPKTTEDSVRKMVLSLPQMQKAVRKAIDAKYHQDVCQAAVDTLDHLGRVLGKLVDLYLSDYWSSSPKISPFVKAEADDLRRRGAYDRNTKRERTE